MADMEHMAEDLMGVMEVMVMADNLEVGADNFMEDMDMDGVILAKLE